LETPAGLELNSAQVAGRIGEFVQHHLRNYQPRVTVVPARKLGTPFSPDDARIAGMLPGSDAIFLGPGSPTYAVRQLAATRTWHTLLACHRLGASLVLSSAATIAVSAKALPVYEIYKVGEDPHWIDGLGLLAPYGLSLVFVPHWNNRDGGKDLDTSRCYIGQARLEPMLQVLPPQATVVGIDEQTALVLDLAAGTGRVLGRDGVTILRAGADQRLPSGHTFPLGSLGPFHRPDRATGIPEEEWQVVVRALEDHTASQDVAPPPEVQELVDKREAARARSDWQEADQLRTRIAALGWTVGDTRRGPRAVPSDPADSS
jgi:hypothetical protein